MAVSACFVPSAPGKVGHGDGSTSVFDRQAGQFGHAAPFRQVIHVHVQRQSVAQAIYQAVVHDKVHAAVSAHSLGYFFQFLMDGMFVLHHQGLFHFFGHSRVHAQVLVDEKEILAAIKDLDLSKMNDAEINAIIDKFIETYMHQNLMGKKMKKENGKAETSFQTTLMFQISVHITKIKCKNMI